MHTYPTRAHFFRQRELLSRQPRRHVSKGEPLFRRFLTPPLCRLTRRLRPRRKNSGNTWRVLEFWTPSQKVGVQEENVCLASFHLLTAVLVGLYEEPEKPSDPLVYPHVTIKGAARHIMDGIACIFYACTNPHTSLSQGHVLLRGCAYVRQPKHLVSYVFSDCGWVWISL